jgi:hypothetical protein
MKGAARRSLELPGSGRISVAAPVPLEIPWGGRYPALRPERSAISAAYEREAASIRAWFSGRRPGFTGTDRLAGIPGDRLR